MPLEVTLAVLGAALAHATWNAMIKSSRDVLLDMTTVTLAGGIVAAPLLLVAPQPARESWPYLAASCVLHIGYYVAVVGAYRAGDLSHGYPIMRGVAPLLVSVCALVWLGEAPTPAVWAGVLGCSGARWKKFPTSGANVAANSFVARSLGSSVTPRAFARSRTQAGSSSAIFTTRESWRNASASAQ